MEQSWKGEGGFSYTITEEHDAGMSGEMRMVCFISGKMKWFEHEPLIRIRATDSKNATNSR